MERGIKSSLGMAYTKSVNSLLLSILQLDKIKKNKSWPNFSFGSAWWQTVFWFDLYSTNGVIITWNNIILFSNTYVSHLVNLFSRTDFPSFLVICISILLSFTKSSTDLPSIYNISSCLFYFNAFFNNFFICIIIQSSKQCILL